MWYLRAAREHAKSWFHFDYTSRFTFAHIHSFILETGLYLTFSHFQQLLTKESHKLPHKLLLLLFPLSLFTPHTLWFSTELGAGGSFMWPKTKTARSQAHVNLLQALRAQSRFGLFYFRHLKCLRSFAKLWTAGLQNLSVWSHKFSNAHEDRQRHTVQARTHTHTRAHACTNTWTDPFWTQCIP